MLEQFAAFLDAMVTPERKRLYLNACAALTAVGVSEYEYALEQEMVIAESTGVDAFLGAVDSLLKPLLESVLGELGVTVHAEATIADLTDILNALQLVDNYEDTESINALCDAPEGNAAALADVLQLLGGKHAAEYLVLLDTVGDSTIARIEELTTKQILDPQPSPLQVERARSRLTPFATKFTDALILQALMQGGRLGIHISDLILPYRDAIEELPAERAAIELYGFALASDADPLGPVLKEELELLFTDVRKVTAVDVQLTKLAKEFPSA